MNQYKVIFHINGTEKDANALRKCLAQSVSDEFEIAAVYGVGVELEEAEECHSSTSTDRKCMKLKQRQCKCGGTEFSAAQVCFHDIVVDSENNFIRDECINFGEEPYGTYCCLNCGTEYEGLDELPEVEMGESCAHDDESPRKCCGKGLCHAKAGGRYGHY